MKTARDQKSRVKPAYRLAMLLTMLGWVLADGVNDVYNQLVF